MEKKLFGKIKVELEPKAGQKEQYELVKPIKDVAKIDLKEGLVKDLKINPSYWETLPKTSLDLTHLDWDKSKSLSTFALDFKTSPLFGKYWKVMDSFQANIKTTKPQKNILK